MNKQEKVYAVKNNPEYKGFTCVGMTEGGVYLYTDKKKAFLHTEEEVKNFLSLQNEKVKQMVKNTYL